VCDRRTPEVRTEKRRLVRRIRTSERRDFISWREDWILRGYPSLGSYRSYLRSARYEARKDEEVWYSSTYQYTYIHEKEEYTSFYQCESGTVDEYGEVNSSISLDVKQEVREIVRIKREKRAFKHAPIITARNKKKSAHGFTNKKKFVPHAGFDPDIVSSIRLNEFSETITGLLPADDGRLAKIIEDFVLSAAKIFLMKDYRLILLEIVTYIKTFSNKSVVAQACHYILSLFSSESLDRSSLDDIVSKMLDDNFNMTDIAEMPGKWMGDEFVPESGFDDFITSFRHLGDNFTRVRNNPIFQKISYLITACVSLGLCEASSVTWNVAGVKLFSPDTYRKHVDAPSLLAAVMDTIIFFVEGGREFFLHGDIGALLYSDKRMRQVNDDYNFVVSNWDHVSAGNFEKITFLPETEYCCRLDSVIDTVRGLKTAVDREDQKQLRIMESHLLSIRTQYQTKKTTGGFKRAPFVLCIHGESGQGKSVITERLMVDLLVSLGFDPNPKNVAYYNPYDEYDSSLRGNTIGIFMDEVGNTKAEFQTKVPYEFLMRVNNNAKATAVMADLELKNKITIEPEVVLLTTNDPTIGAYDCSKNPVSVLRRVHIYLDFRVRDEFRKDGSRMIDPDKVYAAYGDKEVWEVQDVWLCDAYEYVGTPNNVKGRPDTPVKKYLLDEDGPLQGVGYARMVKFAIDMARRNYNQQKKLVEDNGKYHSAVRLCESCNYIKSICQCSKPDIVIDHLQNISALGNKDYVAESSGSSHMAPVFKHLAKFWLKTKTQGMMLYARDLPFRFVHWCSPIEYEFLLCEKYQLECSLVKWKLMAHILIVMVLIAFTTLDYVLIIVTTLCAAYAFQCYEKIDLHHKYVENQRKGKIFIDLASVTKNKKLQTFLASSAAICAFYLLVKNIRRAWAISTMMAPHGNISPSTYEDVKLRDSEKCAYTKMRVEPIPSTCRENDTSTPDQVCNTVFKNLLVFSIKRDNGSEYCNALAIDSNLILVPKHMVCIKGTVSEVQVIFRRHGQDSGGGIFTAIIGPSTTYLIPDQDLALLYIPSSGSFTNISRLLPQYTYAGSCKLVYKNKDGSRRQEGATVSPGFVGHTECCFNGYNTVLTQTTHRGLCMATFVATCKSPHIVGFHIGGTLSESVHGIAGVLLRKDYDAAKNALSMNNYITHSAGDFPDKILNKDILYSTSIHDKSTVNFLLEPTNLEVYGSCGGGVTFSSRVVPSIISDSVEKHFGVPNIWGRPPSKPDWKAWNDTLEKITHGSGGFSPESLQWAENDYLAPLIELMKDDFRRNMIRPLEPHQVINGVPGERFIDKMNFSSSIGYPLIGEKRRYLVDVEIEGYDDPKDFTPEIWDEIERCKTAWLLGQRAYTPCKAVLKDEPTKITKDKMRMFYGMNIGIQYHLRRLTLGMARFLSMHPLVSEGMVGMNCMSKEWDQWVKYCNSDGFDKCIAGDYKSFDTKMPVQVLLATYKMFKKLLVASKNFSDEDLLIFDGIVSELVYPVIAYNGTLISLTSGQISGTNLTVFTNNAANSLYKRMGFYEIEVKTGNPHTFRECERGGNYGDDCKGTINVSLAPKWNMIAYQSFLAKHGIEFTMPDKTSTMVEYMEWDEAEFLKRTDAYIPELECIVGKLSVDSIFKSLHSVLKSDVLSPTDHAIATIDGAAYEFFAHGREAYDDAINKLQLISNEFQIRPTGIFKTYDMRVEEWKSIHDPSSLEITSSDSC
jgi:hypothetical protein